MTVQILDVISCEIEEVDLDGLRVSGVSRGKFQNNRWREVEPYQFVRKPSPSTDEVRSSLWRGFVSTYELKADRKLYLVSYQYRSKRQNDEHFKEQLSGDFWLTLVRPSARPPYEAERIYVPFVNSEICLNKESWVYLPSRKSSKKTMQGVWRALRKLLNLQC